MSLPESLAITLILFALAGPVVIIGIFYYLKKRLEHKQIMAAIEKGTPLSEIRPPKPRLTGPEWIKYLSTGIGMLVTVVFLLLMSRYEAQEIVMATLLGVGIAWIIRGFLYRKYARQNQDGLQNGGPRNTTPQTTYGPTTAIQNNQQPATPS
jgi:4-hydroxybenzoate polyprenyltransferase